MNPQNHYIEKSALNLSLLKRKPNAHKGDHGSVAILGGQDGMLGALLLASRTALLSGAGRVYAITASTHGITVDVAYPELMFRSFDAFQSMVNDMHALVIGPGLGQTQQAIDWLRFCLKQPIPLLLDADALNLIAANPAFTKTVRNRKFITVMTPHPGEASRLLGCSVKDIQNDRVACALALVKQYQCACVLKGAESVCIDADENYWINPTGNAGLASAGTGDVLSGLIGSMLAQGLTGIDAIKLGAYLHGAAADNLVAKGIGPVGLTASEVGIEIRNLINSLSKE
jgi:ADP-dependent NAD(P)H-hydrate dehydratase / NAD(P)H-hydrate epimerase